jgi:hypothetical protein
VTAILEGGEVDWIGDNGLYHDLATDPNGLAAVVYYDATEDKLIYAEQSSSPDVYTLDLGSTPRLRAS